MYKRIFLFAVVSFMLVLGLSANNIPDKPIKITASNYKTETAKGTVLVEFWAPWCAPCRKLSPVLNEIAKDEKLAVKVGKMNIDNNKTFAIDKGIKTIPTMILYKDGQEIIRLSGVYTKKELTEIISNALK